MTTPGRDPFFDNAKFLLIVLVVSGHSWAPLASDIPAVAAVYGVVYLFHMPAFILVCGYFSRTFTGSPRQIRALIAKVLVPYLLFQAAYQGLERWLSGGPLEIRPTEPRFVLWFLLALCLWRVTAPVWRAVRFPVAVAVLVSLAAGTTTLDDDLALPRVLMFLPWFVLGLRLRAEHFERLRTRGARRAAAVVFPAALVIAYAMAERINTNWLYMQFDNTYLHTAVPAYLAMRILLFVLSAALVAAFFALVPTRRTRFTALGAFTMFPFLVHGLVIKTAEHFDLDGLTGRLGAGAAPLLLAFGLALTLLLSSRPARLVLGPVVEPVFPRWLTPREETRTSGGTGERGSRDEAPGGVPPERTPPGIPVAESSRVPATVPPCPSARTDRSSPGPY